MLEIRCFLQPGLDRLFGKLLGREVPKRAVRPTLIVVHAPGFEDSLGLGERCEQVPVQALITQILVLFERRHG